MPTIKREIVGRAYAYLDPASGRKKAKNPNARTAMIVACQAPPAYMCVLHAWAARASTTEITEEIFRVNELFRPEVIAIETAGQQYLLYSHVADEALRRGVRLPLIEGKQYTEDAKDARITDTVQPLIMQGRLCIQAYQLELRSELVDFPRGATKDLLDALAGCASLMPKPTPLKAQHDARSAILDYLARAGANPAQITQYQESLLAGRS